MLTHKKISLENMRGKSIFDAYKEKGIFGKKPGEAPVVKEAPATVQVVCEDLEKEEKRKAEINALKKSISSEAGLIDLSKYETDMRKKRIATSIASSLALVAGTWHVQAALGEVPDMITLFRESPNQAIGIAALVCYVSWCIYQLRGVIGGSRISAMPFERHSAQVRVLNADQNNVPQTLIQDIIFASTDPRWAKFVEPLTKMELGLKEDGTHE